jgi:hypothetical protein
LRWLQGHGELVRVGVEGTGSYGAGLTRYLSAAGVQVTEVIRPNRQAGRLRGKSDAADAIAAALAALSGEASGTPRARDGVVESIRALQVARHGAVRARTQAGNQLRDLIVTAPQAVREKLAGLPAVTARISNAVRSICAAPCDLGTGGSGQPEHVERVVLVLDTLGNREARTGEPVAELPGDGLGRRPGKDRADRAVEVQQQVTGRGDDLCYRTAVHGCSRPTVDHMESNQT